MTTLPLYQPSSVWTILLFIYTNSYNVYLYVAIYLNCTRDIASMLHLSKWWAIL